MDSIKQILIRRDGMSAQEADNLINDAKEAIEEYLENNDFFAAENVCEEFFGLEPDYLGELIPL